MTGPSGGGRTSWNEDDLRVLSANERLLALAAYQRRRYPSNIAYSREGYELWLMRPLREQDWSGNNFLPSGVGLTYEAFNDAFREIVRRIELGELKLAQDLLDRFPDIRDYTPELPDNGG